MRRRTMRGAIALALATAGLDVGGSASAGDYGTETREIVEAFTTVGNVDASIEDRVAALEDGRKLRKIVATMNGDLVALGGINVQLSGQVFRDIAVRRLHRNAAEVDFAIYLGSQLV